MAEESSLKVLGLEFTAPSVELPGRSIITENTLSFGIRGENHNQMTTSEQWLKTMPSASWRDLDQLKEWIEAIQSEAFNEGQVNVTDMIAKIVEDDMPLFCKSLKEWSEELLKKPLAK